MADLSLKINADFEQAKTAFADLAASSENLQKKIQKWADGMREAHVEDFTDRQKILAAAMTAAGKESDVLTTQTRNYQREIQRLVAAGLTPESEEIQKLQGELINLVQKQEAAAEASKNEAEATAQAQKSLESEAAVITAQLDAKSKLEKENIRLKQSQEDIKEEIKNLISQGYSPESQEVKKLEGEYKELTKQIEANERAHKIAGDSIQNAEKALTVMVAAAAAAGAAIAAMVQKTAEAGDQAAKTARIVGTSAETWQELSYAANMSGVSTDTLKGSMEKLNKGMGELKDGSGALAKYLGDNNKALLNNLQSAGNTEQAFELLMDAIKKAPDEFTRAQLAQAAFGKSGQELILLAEAGTDGIAALREEAKKYGIVSNEAAAQSEEYLDAQSRVQAALAGVRNAFSEKLMPAMTNIINNFADLITKVTDFVNGIHDLPGILEKVGIALGIVAAALAAFIIVDKIAKGMAALNAIMLANPFGLIAAAIAAVIIAVLLLYKNWDTVSTYLQQGIARIEYAFKWLGSQIKEKFILAVNSIKIAFLSLQEIIQSKVLGGVAKLLETLGKMPFVGEMFENASKSVRSFSEGITQNIAAAKAESTALIQAAKDEQDATQKILDSKLAAIDAGARARRDDLERQKKENAEATEAAVAAVAERETQINKIELGSLKKRLDDLGQTEAQAYEERKNQFTQFLQSRLEAENLDGEARLAFVESQKELLLSQMQLDEDEKLALTVAAHDIRIAEDKRLTKKLKEEAELRSQIVIAKLEQMLNSISSFSESVMAIQQNGLTKRAEMLRVEAETELAEAKANADALLENEALTAEQKEAIKEQLATREKDINTQLNKDLEKATNEANNNAFAAAVAAKAIAHAEAGIQTYLAASKAFSEFGGWPTGLIPMAATIAAGLANQIKIASTPIPKLSAETGGSFMIPDTGRVDAYPMLFNGGERVNVTPRGQTGTGEALYHQQFLFDGRVFADMINRLAKAGELYTLQLAGNL